MERFTIKPSQEQGFWVAIDKENGIEVVFRNHQFNETQQVRFVNGNFISGVSDVKKIATALRDLAEWLRKEHYSKAMPDENIRVVIGERIRNARMEQHLTQRQLAQLAGLSAAQLCNIESGSFSVGIDILYKIADALNLEIQLTEKYVKEREKED